MSTSFCVISLIYVYNVTVKYISDSKGKEYFVPFYRCQPAILETLLASTIGYHATIKPQLNIYILHAYGPVRPLQLQ